VVVVVAADDLAEPGLHWAQDPSLLSFWQCPWLKVAISVSMSFCPHRPQTMELTDTMTLRAVSPFVAIYLSILDLHSYPFVSRVQLCREEGSQTQLCVEKINRGKFLMCDAKK
jgi:hypothetical protein